MKAVLYARFSPRPNADECDSVERQLQDLRAFCQSKGWQIASEHSDEALSGADHERPGIWNAISDIRRGSVLLVRNVNRLARDTLLALTIEHKVEQAGGTIHSLEDGELRNDDPTAVLVREILHALAKYQRSINNARTAAGMKRNQYRDHRRMGREDRVPYGFTSGENGELLVSPSEQAAIARICELRDTGVPYRQICHRLTAEGHAPRGKRWYPGTVAAIYSRETPTR